VAMVSAVISAFLYLRIIVAMFMSGGDDGDDGPVPERSTHIRVPFAAGLALTLCVLATVGFGLFPDLLVKPSNDGKPVVVQFDRNQGAALGSTTTGQ